MEVYRIIEKLEELVESRPHVMNKAVLVDLDEFYMLTNKLRAALPEEVRRADQLTREGSRIIEKADDEAARVVETADVEADGIVAQAHKKAEKLVSESEITRLAKAQADEIIARAEERRAEIARGADEYAAQILSELHGHLSRCIITIENGRAHLGKDKKSARGAKV